MSTEKRRRGRPSGKLFPRHKNLSLTEDEWKTLVLLSMQRGESGNTVLRAALRMLAQEEGLLKEEDHGKE
jgi:hypothetical protein